MDHSEIKVNEICLYIARCYFIKNLKKVILLRKNNKYGDNINNKL